MKSMTRQCFMQIFHPFFHTLNIFQKEKNIYALKTVNLKNQSERSKGELIKEIVFLEKLKNCNGVVKAFEYELHETEDDHWMYVLMEKGDMDLQQVLNSGLLILFKGLSSDSSKTKREWKTDTFQTEILLGTDATGSEVMAARFAHC